MSDVVANRAEIPMAILKSFYSHRNVDTAYSSDDFERYKCENCCELRGGRLNFYERGEPDHNTTTTVIEVERRRAANILILRCGPGGRMVIFLEFDSKKLTDEWQEALCQYTGQTHVPNPALRRVKSELPAVLKRRKRRARSRSTLPDILVEQLDSDPQEAPLEAPQEAPLEAHQEAPLEAPQEEAPLEAPQEEAPLEAPQEAPLEAPQEAPLEAPQEALLEALQEAPLEAPQEEALLEAPQEAPLESHQEAPLEAPQEAPLEAHQEAPLEAHQEAPLEAPQEAPLEAPHEAPPAPPVAPPEGLSAPPARPVAPPSPPGSPTEDRVLSFTSDTSDTDSGPASLRSRDADLSPTLAELAKNSVEKECTLSDLKELKVKDCGGDVIVKEAIPCCFLHVGDKIMLTKTNDQGHRMNALEMTEYFQKSRNRTEVLTIVRGAVGVVIEDGCELAINIKGSQTVRLDKVDVILRALTSHCSTQHAEMPERSNLTITAINNIPVAIGSQPDQIAGSMREALETSGGNLTLHLVPQSLLDALAKKDGDTHEYQAHGMVDE